MKNSTKLFVTGLLVHILYVLIISSTNNIFTDIFQKDNGQLTEKISNCNIDSKSYIESSENFIKYDVFGKENNPDYHRTIGYPLIIYFFKVTLGWYWHYGLIIFQIILGALIYPIVYGIGTTIFPKNESIIFYSVIILILLGAFFTKSIYVLTDLPFTFFFLLGVYLSIKSITKRRKIILITGGVALLSFAALVRSTLIFYPVAHFLLLLYVAKKYNSWLLKNTKRIVWISSVTLVFTCNLSSFRLYSFYGNFFPTDILGINMFNYSVKEVLSKEGEKEKYLLWEQEIKRKNSWFTKDKIRKEKFFETVLNYPRSSVLYWLSAAQSHLFSPHYIEIGRAYGSYKRNLNKNGRKLVKSNIMQDVFYLFYFVNVFVFFGGSLYLFYQFLKKEYLFILVFLSIIFLILGPSFFAQTGPRMRITIEPFLIFLAFQYLGNIKNINKDILQLTKFRLH